MIMSPLATLLKMMLWRYLLAALGSLAVGAAAGSSRPILMDCFLAGAGRGSSKCEPGTSWPCLMWTDTVPPSVVDTPFLRLLDLDTGLPGPRLVSRCGRVDADLLRVSAAAAAAPPISRTVT